jgi:hypothetical protein
MSSKAFVEFLSYTAVFMVCAMAMYGAIDISVSVALSIQEWLRSKRSINTEVPALKASVEELRRRQTRFETELEQIRRTRQETAATSLNTPRERST